MLANEIRVLNELRSPDDDKNSLSPEKQLFIVSTFWLCLGRTAQKVWRPFVNWDANNSNSRCCWNRVVGLFTYSARCSINLALNLLRRHWLRGQRYIVMTLWLWMRRATEQSTFRARKGAWRFGILMLILSLNNQYKVALLVPKLNPNSVKLGANHPTLFNIIEPCSLSARNRTTRQWHN